MAVVMFVGSSVVPQSALIVMLSVAVLLGAVIQWIVSAKARRQRCARVVLSLATGGTAYILIGNTCWVWEWLCLAI